jgi:hypothetical protein
LKSETNVAYPSLENPYATRSLDPSILTTPTPTEKLAQAATQSLDDFLLQLYSSILQSNDKQLLANIISDDKIILGRDDIIRTVGLKIHKTANITIEDLEIGCCGSKV